MNLPPHDPNLVTPTDGCWDPDATNGLRARSAQSAMLHYHRERGFDSDEATCTVDLITDLLHHDRGTGLLSGLKSVLGFLHHPAISCRFSDDEMKIRYSDDPEAGSWMSVKNKKQFGIWMDTHHATIVGYADSTADEFSVLGHAKNPGADGNSNENAAHNQKKTLQAQFFKEITTYMQNAEEVHVTGTGTIQEQFIHYLAETPQFKNTMAKECTSNKMSDERLVEFIAGKFN